MSCTNEETEHEFMWHCPPFSSENSLHNCLYHLEESMRCPICHEFYKVPVMLLPCAHSFCSECIRKALQASKSNMQRKAKCPNCNREILLGDESRYLVANRALEQTVRNYDSLRGNLRNSLAHLATKSTSAETNDATNNDSVENDSEYDSDESYTGAARKRCRVTRGSTATTVGATTQQVQEPAPQRRQEQRQRRPVTHYHNLGKKKLQAKCREEGLLTEGSDAELKARHQEFITLYNSESLSLYPKSHAELVKEIHRRERARKMEAKKEARNPHAKLMAQLKSSMANGAASNDNTLRVSSGSDEFDKKLNANFASLIAQHRKGKELLKKRAQYQSGKLGGDQQTMDDNPPSNASSTYSATRYGAISETAAVQGDGVAKIPIVLDLAHENPETPRDAKQSPAEQLSVTSIGHESATANVSRPAVSQANQSRSNSQSSNALLPVSTLDKFVHCMPKNKSTPRHRSFSKLSSRAWDCLQCTFRNEEDTGSRSKCAMCGNRRSLPNDEGARHPDEGQATILMDV